MDAAAPAPLTAADFRGKEGPLSEQLGSTQSTEYESNQLGRDCESDGVLSTSRASPSLSGSRAEETLYDLVAGEISREMVLEAELGPGGRGGDQESVAKPALVGGGCAPPRPTADGMGSGMATPHLIVQDRSETPSVVHRGLAAEVAQVLQAELLTSAGGEPGRTPSRAESCVSSPESVLTAFGDSQGHDSRHHGQQSQGVGQLSAIEEEAFRDLSGDLARAMMPKCLTEPGPNQDASWPSRRAAEDSPAHAQVRPESTVCSVASFSLSDRRRKVKTGSTAEDQAYQQVSQEVSEEVFERSLAQGVLLSAGKSGADARPGT